MDEIGRKFFSVVSGDGNAFGSWSVGKVDVAVKAVVLCSKGIKSFSVLRLTKAVADLVVEASLLVVCRSRKCIPFFFCAYSKGAYLATYFVRPWNRCSSAPIFLDNVRPT